MYRGKAPGREQQLAHIATASVNAMPPVRPNATEIVADREVGRKQRGMVVAAQMDCFSALPGRYERAKSPIEAEGRGSLNTMKAVRAYKRGGLRYEDAPRPSTTRKTVLVE